MNKLKTFGAAVALLAGGVASASATLDTDSFSITYDDTTQFGAVHVVNTGAPGLYGFEWVVPNTVSFVHNGGAADSVRFALPSFTLMPKSGFALNGLFSGSLGNIVYSQFNGSASAYATAFVNLGDAWGTLSLEPWVLNQTASTSSSGYFSGSFALSLDGVPSVKVWDAYVHFGATDNSFVAVTGQPQNRLTFQFGVSAVPEPEGYAMLIVGVGVVSLIARRRQMR